MCDVFAIEQDTARSNSLDAQHGTCERRFSAAGFAHERKRFTAADAERNTIDRVGTFASAETNHKVFDPQKFSHPKLDRLLDLDRRVRVVGDGHTL